MDLRATARGIKTTALTVAPTPSRGRMLSLVRRRLLLDRRWAYLRYLHMREGLLAAEDVRSVLAVGVGRGTAEIALAVEFPDVHFHLTDFASARSPYYDGARRMAKRWRLPNVTFGVLDVLDPPASRFDLVCSVEVLEHIDEDETAARNMATMASRYVFALVPFADAQANSDPELQQREWEAHEHHRVGYDAEALARLFPGVEVVRGCYWTDGGGRLRGQLEASTDRDIRRRSGDLAAMAASDVRDQLPADRSEGQGIWVLARTSAP